MKRERIYEDNYSDIDDDIYSYSAGLDNDGIYSEESEDDDEDVYTESSMDLDDLLVELGIDKEPVENENGSYTIDISDSNEYSRYYTKLDKADFIDEDDEASQVNIDSSTIQFISDDFTCTLIADFEEDTYKLVIREMQNR